MTRERVCRWSTLPLLHGTGWNLIVSEGEGTVVYAVLWSTEHSRHWTLSVNDSVDPSAGQCCLVHGSGPSHGTRRVVTPHPLWRELLEKLMQSITYIPQAICLGPWVLRQHGEECRVPVHSVSDTQHGSLRSSSGRTQLFKIHSLAWESLATPRKGNTMQQPSRGRCANNQWCLPRQWLLPVGSS